MMQDLLYCRDSAYRIELLPRGRSGPGPNIGSVLERCRFMMIAKDWGLCPVLDESLQLAAKHRS
jgi:hypothetical protein